MKEVIYPCTLDNLFCYTRTSRLMMKFYANQTARNKIALVIALSCLSFDQLSYRKIQ